MRKFAIVLGFALLVASSGCAQETEDGALASPTAEATPGATPSSEIAVVLQEWAVLPSPDVGKAGTITFDVQNRGEEVHEFVVVETDLDPGKLPTADDGSADEDELDVLGEIEDLAAGKSEQLELELEAGSYVLLCNVVETEEEAEEHAEEGEHEADVEAHYKLGMRTAFTVR